MVLIFTKKWSKGPRTKSRTKSGPGGSPMYTRDEREGTLWEFRQGGLSVPEACRSPPLFPTRTNLYRWLRMEEVKLAEALTVLDVLKAPGPASLTSMEKWRAGELARERCPLARLRDVTETLSIPKSTYLDQAARAARADPKAALRARVRASFEASGGAYGAESVAADLRSGPGAAVSWRDLEPGDALCLIAS